MNRYMGPSNDQSGFSRGWMRKGFTIKDQKENVGGDGNVLQLGHKGGYMDVGVCQNSQKCIFKLGEFY